MASENKVTLYGSWASPYVKRVKLALKQKDIPYEYVEEDLMNKSATLISYNPVHRKVPVLVHNGKAICESLVIIEYINDTWKDGPKLLPDHPYQRSQARFWASFIQQKLIDPLMPVLKTEGEAQEKLIKELNENLLVLEENFGNFDPGLTCVDGTSLGLLDIVFGSAFGGESVDQEVLGKNVMELEKIPVVCSWIKALRDNPLVKESAIPRDKLVGLLKFIRHSALISSHT